MAYANKSAGGRMIEKFPVSIKYSGKDVEDGSMSIADVAGALQGFANAYTKIVIFKHLDYQHNIRIKGIEKGSVNFILEVVENLNVHADSMPGLLKTLSAAGGIILTILKIIDLTRHTKGKSYEAKAEGNNSTNIIIQNCEKVNMVIPKDIYPIFEEGLIKQDISKIAEPLSEGKIESVTIQSDDKENKIGATITSNERNYFSYEGKETTTTKEMNLIGHLISLNKERNMGSFRLQDGTRVPYRFKSDHPETMYTHFLHKGLVRARCFAHLDENLKPIQIDITRIAPLGKFMEYDT